MSYSENGNSTNFTMPVQPYGGSGGWGNDIFGGNAAWWLIILLLFANNGWGGFGFGNGIGGMAPMMIGSQQSSEVQRGYSRHSISDRAVSCLEQLFDSTASEYEKQELKKYIAMVRNAGMND